MIPHSASVAIDSQPLERAGVIPARPSLAPISLKANVIRAIKHTCLLFFNSSVDIYAPFIRPNQLSPAHRRKIIRFIHFSIYFLRLSPLLCVGFHSLFSFHSIYFPLSLSPPLRFIYWLRLFTNSRIATLTLSAAARRSASMDVRSEWISALRIYLRMHLASGTELGPSATPSSGSHIVLSVVEFGRLAACNAKSIRVSAFGSSFCIWRVHGCASGCECLRPASRRRNTLNQEQ